MLFNGLKLKLLEKGKVVGVIVITEVIKDDKKFIAKDDSTEAITEFKFLEKTNAWHLVFEGLGGEHCVKEEIPYTLCPM